MVKLQTAILRPIREELVPEVFDLHRSPWFTFAWDHIAAFLWFIELSMHPKVQAAYDRVNHSQPPEEEPG